MSSRSRVERGKTKGKRLGAKALRQVREFRQGSGVHDESKGPVPRLKWLEPKPEETTPQAYLDGLIDRLLLRAEDALLNAGHQNLADAQEVIASLKEARRLLGRDQLGEAFVEFVRGVTQPKPILDRKPGDDPGKRDLEIALAVEIELRDGMPRKRTLHRIAEEFEVSETTVERAVRRNNALTAAHKLKEKS